MNSGTATKVTHILLIEDEKAHQDLVLRAFRNDPEKFRVSVAGNLHEAQQITERDLPDLIISDWILPDGKGLDILVRKEGVVTIPLIIMTSYGDEHLAVEIMKSGAIDYVVKSATAFNDLPQITRRALRDWENIHERKRAEHAVRDSEKRLADIIEFLPDAVLAIDNDGRVIAWNNAMEQMTGVAFEEMLGKGNYEYSLPFYGERRPILINLILIEDEEIEKKYLTLQRNGERISSEVYIPTLFDRKGVYLWGTASPLYDSAGKRIGAIEIIRDITDRKKSEEALCESEEILQDIIEKNPMSIQIVDKDGFNLKVNHAHTMLFGSIPPSDFSIFADLTNRQPALEKLIMLAKSGEVVNLPDIYFNAHDSLPEYPDVPVWVSAIIFPLKDNYGKPERFVFMHENITERKRSEQELVSARQKLTDAQRLAHIGTWEWNMENDTVTWSEELYNLAGRDPSLPAPTYAEHSRLYTPSSWDRLSALVTRALTTGEPYNLELELIRSDGSIRWVNTFCGVKRDKNGKVIGLYGTLQDISERKLAELLLQKREAVLETLLNAPHDTISLIDRQGIIIGTNKENARQLGGTVQNVTGRCVYDLLPPDVAKTRKEHIDEVFDSGEPALFDYERSGLYLHNEIYPIFNLDHTLVDYIALFASDITEQKKIVMDLKKSEERFRHISGVITDFAYSCKQERGGVYLLDWVTEAVGTITGFPVHEILAMGCWRSIVVEEDLQVFDENIGLLLPGMSSRCELRIRTKDGAIRWLRCFAECTSDLASPECNRLYGGCQDITGQKIAEHVIQESEIRYKDLINNMSAGVAIYEPAPDGKDFIIRDINHAVETIEQVKKDEIVGKSVLKVFPGVVEFGLFDVFQRVAKTGIAESYPVSMYRDDRISGWRENYIYRLPSGDVVAVYEDVTEKKQVYEALQVAREWLGIALSAARAGTWDWNIPTGQLTWSPEFFKLFDLPPGAMASFETWLAALHPDDRKPAQEKIEESVKGHFPLWNEYRILHPDGDLRWIGGAGSTSYNEAGEPLRMSGVCIDITNRKLAEEKLHESEYRSVMLLKAIPDMMFIISREGIYRDFSVPDPGVLALPVDQIIGTNIRDSGFLKESTDAIIYHIAEALRTEKLQMFEYELMIAGSKRQFETRIVALNKDDVLCIVRDITDRKQAEEASRQSEARYRLLAENISDVLWVLNIDTGKWSYMSPSVERLRGYTTEEVLAQSVEDVMTPASYAYIQKVMPERIQRFISNEYGQNTYLDEFEQTCRDGSTVWTEVASRYLRDERGELSLLGISRDISDRKLAETTLRATETRFRALIQNSSDIIRILDRNGRILYESPSSERILGYPPGYMIGRDPLESIHTDDFERVKNDFKEVIGQTNSGTTTEFRIRKADGEYLWVDSVGNNLLDVPGVNGIVITTRPIQQRKEAEERMIAVQRLYAVQSQINQAIVRVKDIETFISEVCRISVDAGRFQMSWVGLLDRESDSIRPAAHAGDEAGYLESILIRAEDDDYSKGPTGIAIKEGHYDICNDIDTDSRMEPWRDEALKRNYRSSAAFPFRHHGDVVGAYNLYSSEKDFFNDTEIALLKEIAMNISFALDMLDEQARRTRAEEALRDNQARLATAMDIANLANWEFDVATGMFTFDDRFYSLYETTADREGGNQMSAETYMREFVYPDDRPAVLAEIQNILATKDPDYTGRMEHRITPRDGSIRTIIVRHAPVMGPDGKVIRTYGANQDITDRMLMESEIRSLNNALEERVKERTEELVKANELLELENAHRIMAEEKLQSSYDEKVMLLKEIHHRVKNNLQIIASLLNLQSRYISDEKTLAAIKESQNRVKAMALVHEKLYRSEDLSLISLHEYIKFLGTGLFQFYDAKARRIQFKLEISDINVDIDAAIPLGLIINELISNSLKYAFPNGRTGEVSISVKKEGHTLNVLFRDTGIGIPKDLDWRDAPSLGLRLVITLVDQMDGTVELDRSEGTRFTIVLHEKESRGEK